MKTQYYTATSIDGFIADDEHSLDWLFQFGHLESMEQAFPAFLENIGTATMGSTTYEWILKQEQLMDHPEKWPYTFPVWVFSSRKLPKVPGANIHFVNGDVTQFYPEIAKSSTEKNIWLIGGGDLAGQFYENGLLDEIILTVAPVTLGSGAPVLPRHITSPPLILMDIQKHEDVFAVLTYEIQNEA